MLVFLNLSNFCDEGTSLQGTNREDGVRKAGGDLKGQHPLEGTEGVLQ